MSSECEKCGWHCTECACEKGQNVTVRITFISGDPIEIFLPSVLDFFKNLERCKAYEEFMLIITKCGRIIYVNPQHVVAVEEVFREKST